MRLGLLSRLCAGLILGLPVLAGAQKSGTSELPRRRELCPLGLSLVLPRSAWPDRFDPVADDEALRRYWGPVLGAPFGVAGFALGAALTPPAFAYLAATLPGGDAGMALLGAPFIPLVVAAKGYDVGSSISAKPAIAVKRATWGRSRSEPASVRTGTVVHGRLEWDEVILGLRADGRAAPCAIAPREQY